MQIFTSPRSSFLAVVVVVLVVMVSRGMEVFRRARELMVEFDIRRKGIKDTKVLDSIRSVPRHLFVDSVHRIHAYGDHPLPIGHKQTISQPFMVALMAEAAQLNKADKVLEIGTGCGYSAAVVSNIVNSVYTVESIPELATAAAQRLRILGYDNVHVRTGDGSVGWSEHSPFDSIIVTASAPSVPSALKSQLAVQGRLIIPVPGTLGDNLIRVTKLPGNRFHEESLCHVRFVPLLGQQGYPSAEQ